MALSLRGLAENSAINGGNVTVTHPAGIAQNDVVYCVYGMGSNAGDEAMSTSTSGYTELADIFGNDLGDANLGAYRKIMGATPDSTIVLVGDGDAANAVAAVEQVWTGADTTTPEDATTTTATGINSSVPDSPSITTVTANAIVISAGCGTANATGDTTVTAPTGYSNQVDRNSNDSIAITIGMASKLVASPGAENPAAWTNWTTTVDDSWCAVTIAIRPAADTGPGPALNTNPLPLLGVGRKLP